MRIAYTSDQDALRRELRAYFAALMTPERREGLETEGEYGDGEAYKDIVAQMGRDGWLAIGWPVEYGGQARPMVDQLIFTDEASVAGVPVPFLTLNTIAPTLMKFGTDEQRTTLLPRIARGEAHFAVGYSEPEAAPTWRHCAPVRSATVTTTSSTGRRCGPASSAMRTTCGWPAGPTRRLPSTRACRS